MDWPIESKIQFEGKLVVINCVEKPNRLTDFKCTHTHTSAQITDYTDIHLFIRKKHNCNSTPTVSYKLQQQTWAHTIPDWVREDIEFYFVNR